MSSTTTDPGFDDTPVMLGRKPTTYGELRDHCQGLKDAPLEHFQKISEEEGGYVLGMCIQGLSNVLLHAFNELEKASAPQE